MEAWETEILLWLSHSNFYSNWHCSPRTTFTTEVCLINFYNAVGWVILRPFCCFQYLSTRLFIKFASLTGNRKRDDKKFFLFQLSKSFHTIWHRYFVMTFLKLNLIWIHGRVAGNTQNDKINELMSLVCFRSFLRFIPEARAWAFTENVASVYF